MTMKFVVAIHGTRGDIEPSATVATELCRRGHEVRMAVPPNLVPFVERIGLSAESYGVDSQQQLDADTFRDFWKIRNPVKAIREGREYMVGGWAEMSATVAALADGADVLLTGTTYQEVVANVAESEQIPLAALHYFPHRANSQILPIRLPGRIVEPMWAVAEWGYWQILKSAEDAQRRELGLAPARSSSVNRIVSSGTLEIQAYDEVFFPGLRQEWRGTRPFVGALTLELPTDTDDDVTAWAASGKPPIYFGFGSMPVQSPADAVTMISSVCTRLGERALISSGAWNLDAIPESDHVKVVGAVNHAKIFPLCRAVVHHGGAGTTAAGLRAARPTLILWVGADQPVWAAAVKRLQAGTAERFSKVTPDSLLAGLQTVLTPRAALRARQIADEMTTPADSVRMTADLLEAAARPMPA
ncbi:UDP-glycosyltransferase [Mycolicibacterium smegmatis]|nr:UDP-glycosyltransferase [Mycolicibacterium smegmatis]